MNAITSSETRAMTHQPVQGPLAVASALLSQGLSIADLRSMLDLQKEWEANEARKAYVADMADFKKNAPTITKDKQVSFGDTYYSHASIGNVVRQVAAPLARYGFSHRWDTVQEGGHIHVTCTITHRLGHSESTTLDGIPDASGKKNANQQTASTITYLQRYTLLAAIGLATADQMDDDGRGGEEPYDAKAEMDRAKAELDHWCAMIDQTSTLEALREVRTQALNAFKGASDPDGWAEAKARLAKRKEVLTPVDVEAQA